MPAWRVCESKVKLLCHFVWLPQSVVVWSCQWLVAVIRAKCVCVKLPLQLGLLLLAAQACACPSFGTMQILLLCPPFFTFRFCCVAGPLSVAPLPPSSAKPEWVSNQKTEHPARKAFRAFFCNDAHAGPAMTLNIPL